MGGTTRRVALVVMLVAITMLLITLLTRSGDSASSLGAAPTAAGDQPPLRPTSTPTPNPFAVSTDDKSVTINRLWSPGPLTARAEGITTTAGIVVTVETDGRSLPPMTLEADADGRFSLDIPGLEPGPQELCVADACQRVLVAAAAQESPQAIEARIDQAVTSASARFDLDALIPGWTFVTAGANSSVGGSADAQTKTITINANPGRSLNDYEITVIHEIGHAVDATWLSEDQRVRFRELRQIDPTVPWGSVPDLVVGDDRWRDAGEDFAEMFVALVLGADYSIETGVIARQPSAVDLRSFCLLIDAAPLGCA